jgi:hypothetical protein
LTIIQAAKEVMESNSRWTSAAMLELNDGTWQDYVPGAPEVVRLQQALHVRIQQSRYGHQKEILENQVASQGQEIFVATYLAYERNGKSFSVATWSEGVEAWLPHVDYLIFLKPVASGEHDMITVTWDVACAHMGSEMSALPDVLPVRFHTNTFPNADILERLRAQQVVMGE